MKTIKYVAFALALCAGQVVASASTVLAGFVDMEAKHKQAWIDFKHECKTKKHGFSKEKLAMKATHAQECAEAEVQFLHATTEDARMKAVDNIVATHEAHAAECKDLYMRAKVAIDDMFKAAEEVAQKNAAELAQFKAENKIKGGTAAKLVTVTVKTKPA